MAIYLTRKQVSENYPITFSNLAHLASGGRGPIYRIIGKSAVYKVDDIEIWLESQIIELIPIPAAVKLGRPHKVKSINIRRRAKDNG